MEAAREAQEVWASRPIAERLRTLRALRHLLALRSSELVAAARGAGDRSEDEILSSEVIPLADACRFLEREADHILAPRRPGAQGRPFWLSGVEAEVRREPLGLVLVVAPSNYPLFLPGVQALQALAAGNAVLWKPGRGGSLAARRVAALAAEAGLDPRLLTVLPEDPETVRAALDAGVDKVLLTGSASTGRKVLAELASRLVPATMELSGCDALFVLPGADLDRVARAVHFGLTLNGGATCIAPRRVFVPHSLASLLGERISALLAERPAPRISLMPVSDSEEALADAALCPYALGASVFGPEEEALAFASRVRAGVVVVNDVIVPTADPRLPFGGRGESGFGVTRGAEGLLEMTVPKVVSVRRGRRLPHLEERHPEDAALFRAYLTLTHGGGLRSRLRGLSALLAALVRRGRGSGRSS
ncbi:MAG TPA: aldehyde dehydrogenase family protein [Thermoanaerobaculia bacterium]|nr:aldehyde dehydrogenase family protein [Thermoanaerobaculia bacterium]